MMKKLTEAEIDQKVEIKNLLADGLIRERMLALGFTKGAVLEVVRKGPLNDLTLYSVRGTMIALRSEESQLIEI